MPKSQTFAQATPDCLKRPAFVVPIKQMRASFSVARRITSQLDTSDTQRASKWIPEPSPAEPLTRPSCCYRFFRTAICDGLSFETTSLFLWHVAPLAIPDGAFRMECAATLRNPNGPPRSRTRVRTVRRECSAPPPQTPNPDSRSISPSHSVIDASTRSGHCE